MEALTYALPILGTNPVRTTAELHQDAINAVFADLAAKITAELEVVNTGLNPKGDWVGSGSFPSGALRGDYYVVTTGGTISGQTFVTGDWLVATRDAPSTSTYNDNWSKYNPFTAYAQRARVVPNAADYASVQEAIDASLALGQPVIRQDTAIATALTLTNRSNVIFTGRGSFAKTNEAGGTYRRQVIPDDAPVAQAFPDRVDLSALAHLDTITVVTLLDSLATYRADSISPDDGFTERLRAKLQRDNPGKVINVISRAIGAQTFATLDSVPTVTGTITDTYPWYTNPATPWLDYVSALSPDVVVIFGTPNGVANFDPSDVESVRTKILAFPKVPKIIWATSIAHALSPHADYATLGEYDNQEGCDRIAGYLRSYSAEVGDDLIDINRTFGLIRDGRDILDCHFVAQATETFASASLYLAAVDQRCRDFALDLTMQANAYTQPNPVTITTSDGIGSQVLIGTSGGFLTFQVARGRNASGAQRSLPLVTSAIPVPTAQHDVEITVRGSKFSFKVVPNPDDTSAAVPPFVTHCTRWGGLHRPTVQFSAGGGTGPVRVAKLYMGVERPYQPIATDRDIFGLASASLATQANGGDGLIHPSSLGSALLYGTHFNAQSYQMGAAAQLLMKPVTSIAAAPRFAGQKAIVSGALYVATAAAAAADWKRVGLDQPTGFTVFAVDANQNVTHDTHGPIIQHTGTLTANRNLNLLTPPGSRPGQWIEVFRTGSGAFNLVCRDNGTASTLKNLTTGTWARFVWSGTLWILAASGSV